MVNIPKIQWEMDSIKMAVFPDSDTLERKIAFFELCQTTRNGLGSWLIRLREKFDVDRWYVWSHIFVPIQSADLCLEYLSLRFCLALGQPH